MRNLKVKKEDALLCSKWNTVGRTEMIVCVKMSDCCLYWLIQDVQENGL